MNDRRMRLGDFSQLARQCRESGYGFAEFRQLERVHQLGWPDDVLEQWVFDHAENVSFLNDYGELDLAQIAWQVEVLPVDDFMVMPTGPSDRGAIEDFAENPDHWVAVRRYGVHMGVGLCWEVHGTWKRWPIVLDRDLVNPGDFSLQLVEGRTRVGHPARPSTVWECGGRPASGMGRPPTSMSGQTTALGVAMNSHHEMPR